MNRKRSIKLASTTFFGGLFAAATCLGATAFTVVQKAQAVDTSSTTHTVWAATLAQPVAVGHLIIVYAREGTSSTAINGCSDSLGNAYQTVATVSGSSSTEAIMCSSLTTVAGTDTVAVHFSVASLHTGIVVVEYSGGAAVLSLEAKAIATASSTTACSSGSLTTIGAADLIVFGCDVRANQTLWTVSGAGFTLEESNARIGLEDDTAGVPPGTYLVQEGYSTSSSNENIIAAFTSTAQPTTLTLGNYVLTLVPPCPSVPCALDFTVSNLCSTTLTSNCIVGFQLTHVDATTGQTVVDANALTTLPVTYTIHAVGMDSAGNATTTPIFNGGFTLRPAP